MKRKQSLKNGAEDDNESSCIKSHPLFPCILQAINGNPPTSLPEDHLNAVNFKDPDRITSILLDLLQLLIRNINATKDTEPKNAIVSPMPLANCLSNSHIKLESGQVNHRKLNHTGIEAKTHKKRKLNTECISSGSRIGKSPVNIGLNTLASIASNQGPSMPLEVKTQGHEDESHDVIAHPLFPYVVRAIKDPKTPIPNFIPFTNGCNRLVTLVLKDFLKLLEKRPIEP